MDTITRERVAHPMPWRLPLKLILTLLVALTGLAGSDGCAFDSPPDGKSNLTLIPTVDRDRD